MEDFDYVSSLPASPIEPTNLPKPVDLGEAVKEGFKSVLPTYTRVNPTSSNETSESESIEQMMDRINNTPTGVNYTPNILAPVTIDIDTSKYAGQEISLAQLQSGKADQFAAQNQSYWDRLWNDTKVTGANLGIGFATAFTGIYDMINDGSFIPSEDSVTSKLGSISSEFAEKNTNFQTQYDIDNPIKSLLLPAYLTGSSKGWGDIARSASIGIGTAGGIILQEIGVTYVTGGTGTIPTLAANIRNLIRSSKVLTQAAETANTLRAGTTALDVGIAATSTLNSAIQTANTTKNIINFGKNTVRGALSAYGESAFEAQETRDSFTLEKIKEFNDVNGRLPNDTELKRIKDVAEQAHDARFLLNFGLLTFSNMPFLNGVFKQFDDVLSVSEQAAAKGLKYTGRAGDGFEKSFQLNSNWWNKNAVTKGMKTALETGQPLAKNILTGKSITWSEGLEEGYQFWVDKATNNYYNTIYNKGTNDIIDGTLTDTIYGLANSFYQTKDQLLSTEGLQNIIGGILGGTGQSIVSKGIDIAKNGFEDQFKEGSKFRTETNQQVKEGAKELLELQKAINLESITGDLSSKIEAVRGAYTGVGLMQESNSVISFDKLKDVTKFHTIAPMVMRGQTDILKDQLTSTLQDINDEEFKLMTGVSEVNPGIKQKYISDVLNDIDKVDKSVRRNLSTFRNRYQKGSDEYKLYEDAKKVFAFHGYISENMIERKKDLESKNSILFNAPNITSALELATQGNNKEGLLNQIKQRKTQFESDIQIATPVVKEGEKTQIDVQTQQLIKQTQQKVDTLTELENKVNSFKGENTQEVFELLTDVLIGFDQLDLVTNDDSLNLKNQLDKILSTFTDHQILSTNLAEHLETYNNLVQNYSDSKKLKETLDKYKEQGMIVQSSFKGLKEFNKFNDVRSYFIERATEVGLFPESEFFIEITKGIKQLQTKDAEFEEYKELIDKNIEQFQKENQPEEIPVEETLNNTLEGLDKKNDFSKVKKGDFVNVVISAKKTTSSKAKILDINTDKDEEFFTISLEYILTGNKETITINNKGEFSGAYDDKYGINRFVEILDSTEEQPNVETQTADDLYNEDIIKILKDVNIKINKNQVKDENLPNYIEQLNDFKKVILAQLDETNDIELKTRVLKNIDFLINRINRILNTVTEEQFDAEVDKKEKPKPTLIPEVKKEEEEETIDASTNSISIQTVVYVENKEVLYLKKNPEKLAELSNIVQDSIQGKTLDIDNLEFELTKNNVTSDVTNLFYNTAFKRSTSPDSVQVTQDGKFVTLIQSTENLILDVPLILKHIQGLTKEELDKLGKKEIKLVDALKENILTKRIFELMKDTKYGNKKLLQLNEGFEVFKSIILTQQEKYKELTQQEKNKGLKSTKDLKSKFKELYELSPYANGMNPNEEGKYVEADFTPDLPFNFIGNWKNPIFTIKSDNLIVGENYKDLNREEINDVITKLKSKLDELQKNNVNFYNILKDQGTFFTAFTTELGEIFIKPIRLKKFNNSAVNPLELENQVFDEKGNYIKGKAKELGEQYVFFAFDNNKNGQSIRLKFVEQEKKLNAAFVVFSERDEEKVYADYYLNDLSKEDFQKLLDGKLTKKPQLNTDRIKEDLKFPKELDVYNLTIVERIKQDVSKLLDGTYKVADVNNPTSIFQNVGFRLKFKEKQEKEIIPESLVIETPEVETKIYGNKEGIDFVFEQNSKLEEIGSREQYSEYLKTIFPDSKVQDIVYHGSPKKIQGNLIPSEKGTFGKGIYLTKIREGAKDFAYTDEQLDEFGFPKIGEKEPNGSLITLVINVKNPQNISVYSAEYDQLESGNKVFNSKNIDKEITGDSIIGDRKLNTTTGLEFIVFKQEQTHILGSKQDQEMFFEFVNGVKPLVERMYNATKEDKKEVKSEEPINKSIEDKIKDLEDLGKENLKSVSSDDGTGLKTEVYDKLKDEFKNKSSISEIFSKFEELKNLKELNPKMGLGQLKKLNNQKIKELKSYFIESKSTPITQRAIVDNKEIEEIAKQYTINCK